MANHFELLHYKISYPFQANQKFVQLIGNPDSDAVIPKPSIVDSCGPAFFSA